MEAGNRREKVPKTHIMTVMVMKLNGVDPANFVGKVLDAEEKKNLIRKGAFQPKAVHMPNIFEIYLWRPWKVIPRILVQVGSRQISDSAKMVVLFSHQRRFFLPYMRFIWQR